MVIILESDFNPFADLQVRFIARDTKAVQLSNLEF